VRVRRSSRSSVVAAVSVALTVGVVLTLTVGVHVALAAVSGLLLVAAVRPQAAGTDWRGFWRWWRLQTRPLGKGTAMLSASTLWPGIRGVLRPDYVWVIYPGAEHHKRAYFPPWVERRLRAIFPTGIMRFGDYWGMVVGSLATPETLERSPERLRELFEEVRDQFPEVPIALAGRLPGLAVRSGIDLEPPFLRGDRGTLCAMLGTAREAARVLGRDPEHVTFAVVGSKGFIGARLVEDLTQEFGSVIALDSRYEEARSYGEGGILHTRRAEDLAWAEVMFVLTRKGADMDEIAPYVTSGAVVADDTYPEMPEGLRARMEERGATVLKATMGDERVSFIPQVPDFRRDDIPGCLLEAVVVAHRGEGALATQEAFNRAADEVGLRPRLAPHSNRSQGGDGAPRAPRTIAPRGAPAG
jgi:hypothetical protein